MRPASRCVRFWPDPAGARASQPHLGPGQAKVPRERAAAARAPRRPPRLRGRAGWGLEGGAGERGPHAVNPSGGGIFSFRFPGSELGETRGGNRRVG